MSTASSDSSAEFGLQPVPPGQQGPVAGGGLIAEGSIWLDGDVLACSCPDCGAPMSIRLWLMLADCFRCGASIELSEQQEREALRLLREHEDAKREESREVAAAIAPTMLRKPKPRPRPPTDTSRPTPAAPSAAPAAPVADRGATAEPAEPSATPGSAPAPRPRQRRVAASQVHRGARARIRKLHERGSLAVLFADLLKNLPAWLISLVVHAVLLILLGLWLVGPDPEPVSITLATSATDEDLLGARGELNDSPKAFEFDEPGSVRFEAPMEDLGTSLDPQPNRPPMTEPLEFRPPMGSVPRPSVDASHQEVRMPAGHMFAGRDPQARAQLVEQAGGSSLTEVAVARALKFLSRHQRDDGSWSLGDWNRTPDCDDTCRGTGARNADVAATAMSLMPFLGAGQTHLEGEYAPVVFKGVKWIVEHQRENGDLRDPDGQMYAHAQAAIVLCETYALSGDEQLREPAQAALNYIVRAQHSEGGWRYQPGQAGDTSVVGWQLMALRSGQMAYLYVPAKTFELASLYLDKAQTDGVGGRYAYQPHNRALESMTAEALLCRQYLGWPKDRPGLVSGVKWLLKEHMPSRDEPFVYYWYYATQVMHHYGGPEWNKWNARMKSVLVDTQERYGHSAGSWEPRGGFANRGGRIYMTALAACILEVYYRHMPLYREEVLKGFETPP